MDKTKKIFAHVLIFTFLFVNIISIELVFAILPTYSITITSDLETHVEQDTADNIYVEGSVTKPSPEGGKDQPVENGTVVVRKDTPDGATIATGTTNSDGDYAIKIPSAYISEGPNNFYVKALGAKGSFNSSRSKMFTVIYTDITKTDQEITASNLTLYEGESKNISASTNSGLTLTFKGNKPSVATVSETSGRVTGISAGKMTVTISQSGNKEWNPAKKTITVTVKEKKSSKTKKTVGTPTMTTKVKNMTVNFTFKAKNAKKFKLYRYSNKKWVAVTTTSKKKYSKEFEPGTYKFKVKGINGKVTSKFSKVVKVKIKDVPVVKVMFIGNSYTYYHDTAGQFASIAKKEGKKVVAVAVTNPSVSANAVVSNRGKNGYRKPNVRVWIYKGGKITTSNTKMKFNDALVKDWGKLKRAGYWDYVIIQNHGKYPNTAVKKFWSTEKSSKGKVTYVRRVKNKNRIYLVRTLSGCNGSGDSKSDADKLGVKRMSVNALMKKAKIERKSVSHSDSDSHPTAAGQFIFASRAYMSIFGKATQPHTKDFTYKVLVNSKGKDKVSKATAEKIRKAANKFKDEASKKK